MCWCLSSRVTTETLYQEYVVCYFIKFLMGGGTLVVVKVGGVTHQWRGCAIKDGVPCVGGGTGDWYVQVI